MDQPQPVVIRPEGRICLGEKLPDLQSLVQNVLDTPAGQVILDLGAVSYIDSSGLGEILKLFLECRNRNRAMALRDVPPPILRVLQSSKLDKVFPILPGEK